MTRQTATKTNDRNAAPGCCVSAPKWSKRSAKLRFAIYTVAVLPFCSTARLNQLFDVLLFGISLVEKHAKKSRNAEHQTRSTRALEAILAWPAQVYVRPSPTLQSHENYDRVSVMHELIYIEHLYESA